jgi:hypothetical protein
MPIVQKPDEASFTVIPFDPDFIAELMLRGYNVFPDDGIHPDLFAEQEKLVQSAFNVLKARKDFGEHNLKPENRRMRDRTTPSIREDAPFSQRILPRENSGGGIDFQNVQPNPFVTNMPKADPGNLIDRQLFPNALQSYEL